MRPRFTRRLSLAALFLVVVFFLLARNTQFLRERFQPAPEPEGGWYTVVYVIDADTIVLDPNPSPWLEAGGHVRLIGVDAPEMGYSPRARLPGEPDPFAVEATGFVRARVEGKRVRLEYGRERSDRYGRTLGYIYLEDGSLLNAEVIRRGYARAYRRFPHPRREEFIRLEEEAQAMHRGLWARDEAEPAPAR